MAVTGSQLHILLRLLLNFLFVVASTSHALRSLVLPLSCGSPAHRRVLIASLPVVPRCRRRHPPSPHGPAYCRPVRRSGRGHGPDHQDPEQDPRHPRAALRPADPADWVAASSLRYTACCHHRRQRLWSANTGANIYDACENIRFSLTFAFAPLHPDIMSLICASLVLQVRILMRWGERFLQTSRTWSRDPPRRFLTLHSPQSWCWRLPGCFYVLHDCMVSLTSTTDYSTYFTWIIVRKLFIHNKPNGFVFAEGRHFFFGCSHQRTLIIRMRHPSGTYHAFSLYY